MGDSQIAEDVRGLRVVLRVLLAVVARVDVVVREDARSTTATSFVRPPSAASVAVAHGPTAAGPMVRVVGFGFEFGVVCHRVSPAAPTVFVSKRGTPGSLHRVHVGRGEAVLGLAVRDEYHFDVLGPRNKFTISEVLEARELGLRRAAGVNAPIHWGAHTAAGRIEPSQ